MALEYVRVLVWPTVALVALLVVYKLATTLQDRYLSHEERLGTTEDGDIPRAEVAKSDVAATKPLAEIVNEIWEPRPRWHWGVLSVLLFLVLALGFWAVAVGGSPAYLFAIAGFSIAYAIHFLAVSIGINGVILRIGAGTGALRDPEISGQIRYMRHRELRIVGAGMGVLAGGLLVLLSSGIFLVTGSKLFSGVMYGLGASVIFVAIVYYVRKQRGWPVQILKRLHNIRD